MVITGHQTHGKGQRNNEWNSEKDKNFTLSVVLKPGFLKPRDQFLISQVMSLGVLDYLRTKTDGALIKWPNDLTVQGRKICGMLIENSLRGSGIHHAIVGIGINVNQTSFDLARATSLQIATGTAFDLVSEFPLLMKSLEKYYLMLAGSGRPRLHEMYLANLAGIRQQRTFMADQQLFTGEITGTTPSGRLLIRTDTEGTREFDIKEVKWMDD